MNETQSRDAIHEYHHLERVVFRVQIVYT